MTTSPNAFRFCGLFLDNQPIDGATLHFIALGDDFDDARPEPETRQVIPAQYHEQSSLEVVIEPGENEHDFELTG